MSQHSTDKVRVGLVGAGFVARIHAEAYRRVYRVAVELRGVAAAHRERAATFAEEFGVARVYADAGALLADGEIDLVDVCVPPYLHAPIAIAAARAGKHVIVEKPLTGYFGPAPLPPNPGGFREPPRIGGQGGGEGPGGSPLAAPAARQARFGHLQVTRPRQLAVSGGAREDAQAPREAGQ